MYVFRAASTPELKVWWAKQFMHTSEAMFHKPNNGVKLETYQRYQWVYPELTCNNHGYEVLPQALYYPSSLGR